MVDEDTTSNRSSSSSNSNNDNNQEVAALKKIVDQLVANQVDLEAKVRLLTTKQNQNDDTDKNNTIAVATTENGKHEDGDNSNRNKETTDVLPSETTLFKKTTPLGLTANTWSSNDEPLDAVETKQDGFGEEIIMLSTDNPITNNTDTIVNIPFASPHNDNDGKEEGGDGNGNDDDDDDVKNYLFTDSTHQYLFMDAVTSSEGEHYKVRPIHKFLALGVIIGQYIAYIYIAFLLVHDINTSFLSMTESPTVEISAEHCFKNNTGDGGHASFFQAAEGKGIHKNFTEATSITAENLHQFLSCSDPTELSEPDDLIDTFISYFNIVISYLVIWCFLAPDLLQVFILFTCKGLRERLTGFLLFFQILISFFICFLGNSEGESVGFLDTFLLMVGLIFVHDIDEQLFRFRDIIESFRGRYCYNLPCRFLIVFVVVTVFMLGLFLYLEQKKVFSSRNISKLYTDGEVLLHQNLKGRGWKWYDEQYDKSDA